ncbi:MAG TPA: type II toxin-antitoxin system Phd/YefM family antitoxin [Candidatus Limnocylindria bacterium]|nr:type II toxin-antitoxin system Phd/YefM family antitoxin [Candidatus Limnocylindria bacterium]
MKTLPLAEAKAKLSGLIDDVARRDERVTITKHGRPAAVLMSHDEAASLDATLEIMSDPDFYAEILRNRRALDRGKGRPYDLDEVLGEEVPASRAKSSRAVAPRDGRRAAAAPATGKAKGARSARRAPARSRSR